MEAKTSLTASTSADLTYAYARAETEYWDVVMIKNVTLNGDSVSWEHATEQHQVKIDDRIPEGSSVEFEMRLERTDMPIDEMPESFEMLTTLIPLGGRPSHKKATVDWPETDSGEVYLETGNQITLTIGDSEVLATIDEIRR